MSVYLGSASSSLISDNVKFTGEICYANQLTGFYIVGASVTKELEKRNIWCIMRKP